MSLAVNDNQVLRVRVRDLDGQVVFSDDTSSAPTDENALEAARGRTVIELSRLNADDDEGDETAPAGQC